MGAVTRRGILLTELLTKQLINQTKQRITQITQTRAVANSSSQSSGAGRTLLTLNS